jgi:mono/diheme cytochrome c family protein
MNNSTPRYTFQCIIASIVCVALMSSTKINPKQSNPWVAPSSANAMINPFKGNEKATMDGKKIYVQYCVVCHGDKGKGDGIAAAGLNPKPADHTSDKIQCQSDGAIFWKMTTGRSPMASYEKSLTVDQRWELVNYIRTFKKVVAKK